MNHFGRLLIAAGLPMIALVGFALATNRGATSPDRGQALLSTYLSRIADAGQSARVVQTVVASRPSNFTREMSDYSLGYGVYYQTTDLVQRPTIEPTPAATTVGFTVPGSSEGGRALRYPPDYAACVLIERVAKFEVVVLAEHHDTWNADWVLHTSTLSPQDLIETLGCALILP